MHVGGHADPEDDFTGSHQEKTPTGDWRGRRQACHRGDLYKSHINSLNFPEIQWGGDAKVDIFGQGAGNEGREFK